MSMPRRPGGLKGAEIRLPQPSVGATENLMMAAALARGETLIAGAAREPEIVDLAACLVAMGAEIEGAGSSHITDRGRDAPARRPAPDHPRPDRGRHLRHGGRRSPAAASCCRNARARAFRRRQGGDGGGGHASSMPSTAGSWPASPMAALRGSDAMTRPFPGFATDLQAQFMALMSVAEGAAMITETIFENRFMHVPELARMGARINVHGASALVRGVKELKGAPVMATDLRASVSLVLAAPRRQGADRDQPHLPSRPRLRAARGEARRRRCPDRAGAMTERPA